MMLHRPVDLAAFTGKWPLR